MMILMFEWHKLWARLVVNNEYKITMCYDETGLRPQNMLIVKGYIVNMIGRTCVVIYKAGKKLKKII